MRLVLSRLFVLIAIALATPALAQEAAQESTAEEAAAEGTAAGAEAAELPPAQALIGLLRNDEAREALIAELERATGTTVEEGATAVEEAVDAPDALSIGRQIALATQETAESLADGATRLWEQIGTAPERFAAFGDAADPAVLIETLSGLALVLVSTYGVLIALRIPARMIYARLGGVAARKGPVKTVMLAVATVAMDAALVALAWAAGYAAALMFGDMGAIGIRQTLYLNAFLMVEMARVALRAVLSPSTGELRLIALSDYAARRITRWAASLIALIVYTEFLAVPIVNQTVSFLAGRAVSSVAAFVAVVAAIVLVLRSRHGVADWLTGRESRRLQVPLVNWLARHWHWFALAYLLALLVIVIARPGGLLLPILLGSAKIAGAIVTGLVVSNLINRAVERGVSLPEPVTTRLPLLERRLNTFVPTALMVVRLLVFVIVAAIAIDVVGLFDLRGWAESEFGVEATATMISALLILLFAFLVWLALSSWVDFRLNPDYGRPPTAREKTLLTLLKNAATIAIIAITAMFVLSEIGINIAPLLASAGVLGLAIGFGAQKMVQDIITGVFIQFENAINVGDVVTAAGTTGVVERLTIRSVGLRDLQGTYHMVPFSAVDMVSNFSREFAYYVMDMGVAYQESVGEVRQALEDAFAQMVSDEEQRARVIGDLEWFGLEKFADSAVIVRVRLKTLPGQQWAVGRLYNEIVKRVFDDRGIEIPFPHQTLYWGEAKEGRTPPLRVEMERREETAQSRAAE